MERSTLARAPGADILLRVLMALVVSWGMASGASAQQGTLADAPDVRASLPEGAVPITAEPDHRIRFDNGTVRMFEVVLPQGRATLMHEHLADNFTVSFRTARVLNEPHGGGEPRALEARPGIVGFSSTAAGPYTHRVISGGEETFHVIAMELLTPGPAAAPTAEPRSGAAFELVLENDRGRAYRIILAPGESTGWFTRPAGTALFAISSGRISEEVESRPRRLWDFEPADFRWFDGSEALSIRNEGTEPIELVEIEVLVGDPLPGAEETGESVIGIRTSGPQTPAASHPVSHDPEAVDPGFPPAMHLLRGEEGVRGILYTANGPGPHPTVVLLHGFPGNEVNLDLAQAMRRAGRNVLFLRYRGTWGTGGEFSMFGALEDVARAVRLARDPKWAATYRGDPERVALVGHSFGGFLGAVTAAEAPEVGCFAFLAGLDMGRRVLQEGAGDEARAILAASLAGDMDPENGPVRGDARQVADEMVEHAEAWLLPPLASALAGRPLLLVAGSRDEVTPKRIHHDGFAAALREAGAERLTEVVLDDDHSFSAHRVELARRLVDWHMAECWRGVPL